MWLRIGHRGAAGSRPELTAVAFERAIEIGVDMIELDVQLTRDRRLVVLHDTELGRTVSGRGAVRERDLAQLQALDAGSWFDPTYAAARVMSLDEVIDQTRGRVALNVEIKGPAADWPSTAQVLAQLLDATGQVDSVVVSSFAMGALQAVRALGRQYRLAVLWHRANVDDAFRFAAQLEAEAIHPHYRLVSLRLVESAAKRGLAVNAWTVNEVPKMRKLVDLGVNGLISDHPERFAEV